MDFLEYDNVSFNLTTSGVNTTLWEIVTMADPCVLVPKGLLLLLIILLTICGNLLVLLAVCFEVTLRHATNFFIVNLALADLLLGVSVLPFSATLELLGKRWFFGQEFCSVWAATDVLCCTASIISLCVISVDRYIGVSRPLTYSTIVTERRAALACVFVWLLSFAISVGPLLGWKEPPPSDPLVCEVTKQTGYVAFSVVFSFYLPTIVIILLYQRIYRTAVRQTKFLETGIKTIKNSCSRSEELTLRVHGGRQQRAMSADNGAPIGDPKQLTSGLHGRLIKFRRQKKAAKTLGIVVGTFITCWFPFFFLLPLSTLCRECYIPSLLFDFCFWTGYCNSCLNPIIYACSSRDFKRAFRNLLRCGTRSKDHVTIPPPPFFQHHHEKQEYYHHFRKQSEPF